MTPESSTYYPESQLDRRNFFKGAATASVGIFVTESALITSGCGKNVSFLTATVLGALNDLKPLLPNLGPTINRAIAAGRAFDDAYRSGKFDNIDTLFENFGNTVNSLISAIGVMNEDVRRYVLVGGIALRAIASLLKSQASQPAVAAVVASRPQSSGMAMIDRMADPVVLDKMVLLLTDNTPTSDPNPEGKGSTQVILPTAMMLDMGNRLRQREDLTQPQKEELLSAIMRAIG